MYSNLLALERAEGRSLRPRGQEAVKLSKHIKFTRRNESILSHFLARNENMHHLSIVGNLVWATFLLQMLDLYQGVSLYIFLEASS